MALDFLNPGALFTDPYPVFARLRREAPVHFYEGTHEFLVTRYDDCRTVGSNDNIFGPAATEGRPEFRVMGMPNVLTMSGPEHGCLREGIDRNLTQTAVRSYVEDLTRPVVAEYLAKLRGNGAANLTTELFEPISVRCIGNAMGYTDTPTAELFEWFYAMAGGLALGAGLPHDDPQSVWDRLAAADASMIRWTKARYDTCLSKPDHSLISHIMYGGMAEGQVRALDAMMPTIRVLILGGFQEPGHGAANAATGILSDPEQTRAFAADPLAHALNAFDEGLRWIAPIGVTPRVATADFELNGVKIPEGSTVAIVMSSANRDETKFDDPDRFDMFRRKKPHLAFGFRPHFCSGHYLSRMMGEIALAEAFRALPNLRLDPEKEVRAKGWRFRGVAELPVRWDA